MTLAPAPGEIPARTHLLPALGFVLVGLLGRALIDKALFVRPGPLSRAATGVAWMLACAAYAAFNAWALRRRLAA